MVVADIVMNTSLTLDQVLKGGYYEMHRLWTMIMERRAANMMTQARANDFPHLTEEARNEFWDSLKAVQTRRFRVSVIPQHVLDKLKEAFGGG